MSDVKQDIYQLIYAFLYNKGIRNMDNVDSQDIWDLVHGVFLRIKDSKDE